MTAIAVVGVGAIGGVVAASLAALERDFLLCVRQPFDGLVVQTPRGILKARPQVATSVEGLRPVPWVLLATKAHQTAGAGAWLSALADRGTTVVFLQNGVEHEQRVRPYARDATLLPVVVECRAAKRAPGQVIQRAEATLTVPDNRAGHAFADLFAGGDIAVHLTTDFRTAAWRKLCLNVAGGAITALTDRTLDPRNAHAFGPLEPSAEARTKARSRCLRPPSASRGRAFFSGASRLPRPARRRAARRGHRAGHRRRHHVGVVGAPRPPPGWDRGRAARSASRPPSSPLLSSPFRRSRIRGGDR